MSAFLQRPSSIADRTTIIITSDRLEVADCDDAVSQIEAAQSQLTNRTVYRT